MSEQWQDSDRDIWRYETYRGKRVTVRANAEYLNAVEEVLERAKADNLALRTRLETAETKVANAEALAMRLDNGTDAHWSALARQIYDALSAPESTETSE